MKNRILPLIIVVFTLLYAGCRKEDSQEAGTPFSEEQISTSICGRVMDESGNAIAGASVTAGDGSAISDQWGIFTMSNINVAKKRVIILAEKNGYWKQVGAFIPSANTMNYCNLMMFPSASTQTVIASTGGTITLTDGSKIEFPANAFSTSTGINYSGTVNITIHHIATDDVSFSQKIPGRDLLAKSANGEDGILTSYGMLGATFSDAGGNKLQLMNGKSATITIPIAANQLSNAPSAIPLWFFNETTAKWEEDGSAVKNGNVYTGNVTHFTWWNCDIFGPLAQVQGYVKDCLGNPAANANVSFPSASFGGYGHGSTDANGFYSGNVAANVVLTIQASSYNSSSTFKQIGPLTAGSLTNVSDIILNNPSCGGSIHGNTYNCSNNLTGSTILCFNSANQVIGFLQSQTGNYNFYLPYGSYNILAYKGTFGGNTSATVTPLSPSITADFNLCDTIQPVSTTNNFQVVFTSNSVGSFATSVNVSHCNITSGPLASVNIDFEQTDSIGNLIYFTVNIPVYSMGQFGWYGSANNSNVNGHLLVNNQIFNVYTNPSGTTGNTIITNAPAVGGMVTGSFSGDVAISDGAGFFVTGTLSANFEIERAQ